MVKLCYQWLLPPTLDYFRDNFFFNTIFGVSVKISQKLHQNAPMPLQSQTKSMQLTYPNMYTFMKSITEFPRCLL